jgi:hypothetical protein
MKSISSSSIFIDVGANGLEREVFPPVPITYPELPSLILVIIDSIPSYSDEITEFVVEIQVSDIVELQIIGLTGLLLVVVTP